MVHFSGMGHELELKRNSQSAMDVSAVKETGVICIDDPEETGIPRNDRDTSFNMEETTPLDRSENEEINVTECSGPKEETQRAENAYQDLTELSSSFGDTVSGTENGSMLEGDEVESQYRETQSLYDGCADLFHTGKKKLTDHWSQFIRPLMWRAKWLELRIGELQSRTLKYDAELVEYEKLKQYEFGGYTEEGFDGKSIPFSSHIQRGKLMKRKKRKRVEDTTDIVSFTSNHRLFSYFENKKSGANDGSLEEDCDNLAGKSNHGISVYEIDFRDDDSTWEDTLRKIEVVHSQVLLLKTRIDKVVKENPTPEIGNDLLVEGLNFPEGLNLLPTKIGNTDQLLVRTDQKNAVDGFLVPSAPTNIEPHDFENNSEQVIENPLLSSARQKRNISVSPSKSNDSTPDASDQPDSTRKATFRWNTRNHGKHKRGLYKGGRKH